MRAFTATLLAFRAACWRFARHGRQTRSRWPVGLTNDALQTVHSTGCWLTSGLPQWGAAAPPFRIP